MAMAIFESWDDYFTYPGSNVLANKLGLRDAAALSAAEYRFADVAIANLRENPIPGRFDLDHLKAIHQHLFKFVYEWAGELRTVELAKQNSSFTKPDDIEGEMARIAANLARDNYLKGMKKPLVVEKLSRLYADLNKLHPFREGNGRSSREFVNQLALEAGFTLDMRRISNTAGEWNAACASSMKKPPDMDALKNIFAAAIRPTRSLALEIMDRKDALAEHPELQEAYRHLDRLAQETAIKYPNNPKAAEHFAAQAKANMIHQLDSGRIFQAPSAQNSASPPAP